MGVSDYLLHSTTTEVRDSTVHTETVRLSTDTVLPVDKQELDPQVSGTRSQGVYTNLSHITLL